MAEGPKIMMGEMPKNWKERAANITLCVTEDCNLVCRYCYMTGKNSFKRMTFDTAKKVVDYILKNRDLFSEESVIWDIIGGEPFLEIDLIDQISDYIKQQMFLLEHPWFNSYRFNFSTNGLMYGTSKVQKYIEKNRHHISIGISVDGNKIKHDQQRIRRDGSGSYDDVMRNVKLWLQQFPGNASTKATFSHDDLPYLKDSIISLWDNGIRNVMANVVFENVWYEGDDFIFENQLRELADYILENELWKEHSVRFFNPNIGFPLREEDLKKNFCGAGKMLAVDCEGRFFPCIRFLDFSLNNRPGLCIGDVNRGINRDKLRPFLTLTLEAQSSKECINCEVGVGCACCAGYNYDSADTNTIYQRATFICKMHKANVRANEYFWERFTEVTGLVSPREQFQRAREAAYQRNNSEMKYLMFLTDDNITPHCTYRNWRNTQGKMSKSMVEKGLEFASENNFIPVFLGKSGEAVDENMSIVGEEAGCTNENAVQVFDNGVSSETSLVENCILLVNTANLNNLNELVRMLYKPECRINVILEDIASWGDRETKEYESQLDRLVQFVESVYEQGASLELNILTDRLNLDSMRNCTAGSDTFTLAPNGRFYICPAFYFEDPTNSIGSIESGIDIKNKHLLELENAPICSACDAYHCRRCKYLNKKLTNEINTPSQVQCMVSHIERNKSKELQKRLKSQISGFVMGTEIPEISYMDPFEKIKGVK